MQFSSGFSEELDPSSKAEVNKQEIDLLEKFLLREQQLYYHLSTSESSQSENETEQTTLISCDWMQFNQLSELYLVQNKYYHSGLAEYNLVLPIEPLNNEDGLNESFRKEEQIMVSILKEEIESEIITNETMNNLLKIIKSSYLVFKNVKYDILLYFMMKSYNRVTKIFLDLIKNHVFKIIESQHFEMSIYEICKTILEE